MPALPAAGCVLPAPAFEARGESSVWRDDGDDDDVPTELGGVRLAHLLGEGGMGRVFLGHHPIMAVEVAVKVMHDRHGDRAGFLTEARLAARVQHENLVRLFNAGVERGHRYLVMEHVAGANLKQVVHERGPLPWREAAGLILQAARGLAVAHRQGIVHRDVKPSNLLLDVGGRVKVADLGVARTLLGDAEGTATGCIIGTPAFMAPEQARDPHAATPAADVYALGATWYWLVTGQVPFPGLKFADLVAVHREGRLPDLQGLAATMPPEALAVLRSLLVKDPWARPADGAEVVNALEGLLGLATASTASGFGQRRALSSRRWWLAAAAGLACAGLLLPGWGRPDPAPPTTAVAPPPAAAPLAPPADPPAPVPGQTPTRAVFLLADGLSAEALARLDAACHASGLPVVERQRIATLVQEQDLATSGRIDPASAGRLGRLLGGHIALFATRIDDQIELRCVLVETGEVVASRLVTPGALGEAAVTGLAAAVALLPIEARVRVVDGALTLSAGTRHGLRVGDRLALRRALDAAPFATATVSAVGTLTAQLATEALVGDCDGALAARIGP